MGWGPLLCLSAHSLCSVSSIAFLSPPFKTEQKNAKKFPSGSIQERRLGLPLGQTLFGKTVLVLGFGAIAQELVAR